MTDLVCAEDPEPSERFPAGPCTYPSGRDQQDARPGCSAHPRSPTAVGFTSRDRLTATLGDGQAWIRLAEPVLRALTEPLGVTTVTVDPQFSAPPAGPAPRAWEPRAAEVPRASGANTRAVRAVRTV